ncbi:methyltransferase domain-containing protein [Sphaerospermopsis aphanizomenoides BCCUSP55]|uniref:class I SAM-dependent methyltransferase n=1 Tax=Sphaerospermopsis aphanizomenoides TaxID=459663 RepID=UPI001905BFC0|nr:class I SAM-dependent methyltransferase [Sphaerospermopsis aphanizomenoides]MBK1989592.1 methyltransferase domain-containing protein [Sphaerospermopsis aphanizomenoides BCCUSP55]
MLLKKYQHKKISTDLILNKKVLDIGCGRNKLANSVGMDFLDLPGVDIVADLNQPLPIADEEFEVVHANQVLEHIENIIDLVYEVHRILKPGGIFIAHTPYFRSSWAHIDPTHIRCFTIKTLNYFCKNTYEYKNYRFREEGFEKIEVFLDNSKGTTFKRKFFTTLALQNPDEFENSFLSSLYPFAEVSYLLTK